MDQHHSQRNLGLAGTRMPHPSNKDRRKAEASTNTDPWPSDFEKDKGSFFLDRILLWTLAFVVVFAMIVCVVAIYATRVSTDSTTTVEPTPSATEDLLDEMANAKDVLRDVFITSTPGTTTSPILAETDSDYEITTTEDNIEPPPSTTFDYSTEVERQSDGSSDTVVISGSNGTKS
nr:uncharacterized protein LOC129384154 isoform X2 [Dermacentor andersoni]